MKLFKKIIQSSTSFLNFQVRFYCLRLFYLCRNCKRSNWWRHKVREYL